ncbi:MAG: DUF1343 domain-containing protein, partial [Sedimentisphaerales bacterium]|nr:DUF1343 domain-containing protein [Sedimentisphaerales bacterium]
YKDQPCQGIRIQITDRQVLNAFRAGLGIVQTLYETYPQSFEFRAEHFDRLCGTDTIRKAIVEHQSPDSLPAQWEKQKKSFLKIRSKYLLYQ